YMEVGAAEGHIFDISAQFDRLRHPARGRNGGGDGGETRVSLEDGTKMRGKGRQAVPEGQRVMLAFPGGAGYGDPKLRDREAIRRDLALGYITAEAAKRDYGLSE